MAVAAKKKIAIIEGDFNPIHKGHIFLADILCEKYLFNRVLFCPFSSKNSKNVLLPDGDREKMICSAIGSDKYKFNNFHFSGNFTSSALIRNTYEQLKKEFENNFTLYYVRDKDEFIKMQTWKDFNEITNLSNIILISLSHLPVEELVLDTLGNKKEKVLFIKETLLAFNSTIIRRSILMKKDTIYSDSLLPQTFEYIKSHNLFGINGPNPKFITIYRPGFSGKNKAARDEMRTKFFGNTWRTAFRWGNRVITYENATTIYEDAYYEFLSKDPEGQKKASMAY